MSEGKKPAGFLAAFGPKLLKAGYEIIPIRSGTKRPRGDKWENFRATEKLLRSWLGGPSRNDGVGVLTRKTPAVDIDVRDEAMALALEEYVRDLVGAAPVRIGDAPKRLLVFRTAKPFNKVTSASYIDPAHPVDAKSGKPARTRVEILGDGQQFVAYHVHPDTQKPYRWLYGQSLANISHDDLPELTEEQARQIAAKFVELAEAAGWALHQAARDRPGSSEGERDLDDPFADVAQLTDISEEELHTKLLLVPNAEDYETWIQVGMALYHQFEGKPRGLELWHEWSITADNYDAGALDARWDTLDIERKGRSPITARYILRLAKEGAQKIATETFVEIKQRLQQADDIHKFREVCDEIKHVEFDRVLRAQLLHMVKERFKGLTHATLGITEARDLIRYENPEVKTPPWWIDGWVYCELDEVFYHISSKRSVSKGSFNDAHRRFMLTKKDVLEGRSAPEQLPSDVALNIYQVPVVTTRMYLPGEDEIFTANGKDYVNSYDDRGVPVLPDRLTAADREAVERVAYHFEHLFAVARDRRLFMDWLAWIVQNPGKHPNWACLIQGTEGDGKSFFYELMATVLGFDNVKPLVAKALEEKNTAWAEGSQLVFVEEIRLAGHNRHDVLNAVKPLITNKAVSIRRMNVDWYSVLNVSSYLLTTNFRDAMPLTANDSRYMILFSRFQGKDALEEFSASDPTYYEQLFTSLEHAGALRKWLLDWTVSDDFRPYARAPYSSAKTEMVNYAKSEEAEALEEILAESPRMDMTAYLLNATDLPDEMQERDAQAPYGKLMNKLLLDAGFTLLGKVRVGDSTPRYWSRYPDKFLTNGVVDVLKIRNWMAGSL